MGYFWNEIDCKWVPRPRWAKRPAERYRAERRGQLIGQLLDELKAQSTRPPKAFVGEDKQYFSFIQQNERLAKLYAALLTRALTGTDEELMKEFGPQVAALTAGDEQVQQHG